MKITKKNVPEIARAKTKDITVTKKYMLLSSGRSVFIFNKKFELLKKIEKLFYVYNTYVSPDERYALLVSTGNCFYVLSLDTFEITKTTPRRPYTRNLEGHGCWTFDGESFFVFVHKRESNPTDSASCNLYTLRRYDLNGNYKDFFNDEYWLLYINPVTELKKYLIIGRKNEEKLEDARWYFIWYDGEHFEKYLVEDYNDIVHYVDYDFENEILTLYGIYNISTYTFKGKKVSPAEVQGIFTRIDKVITSSKWNLQFTASFDGFLIEGINGNTFRREIPVDYGVQNVVKVSEDIIAISTWGGVRFFELSED